MPRLKKQTIISGKKIISDRPEIKIAVPAKPNPNSLSKEMFIMIALYGSAVLAILVLFLSVNFLTSALIKDAEDAKNSSAVHGVSGSRSSGNIIYMTDKKEYELSDKIILSIANGSDKSIFLAPCQYFNKFEKKDGDSRKAITLNNCEAIMEKSQDAIEKIPQVEKQSILAIDLGEGLWRGISDIYMDCQKAEVDACKEKKIIYSNEFRINEARTSDDVKSHELGSPQPF